MTDFADRAKSGIFTRYVGSLDRYGEPPHKASFDSVWRALRGALYRELRKRGIWRLSPRYLGIHGWQHWADPGGGEHQGDALDELVADCYTFIFVQRITSLQAQLKLKPNIDGLVYLNVANFIHELQRRHDPFGMRVFSILRRIVRDCVDEGLLAVFAGDPRVGSDTVLTSPASGPDLQPVSEADLKAVVESWCGDLLPDLITTRGKGQRRLDTRVRARVLQLAREATGTFAFRDLVALLKREAWRRWLAIFEHTGKGVQAVERVDGELVRVGPLASLDTCFEARQSFRSLIGCVTRGVASLGLDRRTLEDLISIWDVLVSWAAEVGESLGGSAWEAGGSASLRSEAAPSRREIGRLLGIPRDRLPGLYEKLGEVMRACRASEGYPEAQEAGPRATSAGVAMGNPDQRGRLRHATAEVLGRAAKAGNQPQTRAAQPGDVYVLRPSASWPVEWVILEVDTANPAVFIAAPADTQPLAGSTDVVLAEDSPSGPLTLRCGLAVSVPEAILEPELRSRQLRPADLDQACKKRRQIIDNTLEASVLEEEVELDPAYLDWMREIPEAARAAVEASLRKPVGSGQALSAFPSGPAPQIRRWGWIHALAAVLAAMTVSLSLLSISRQRQLDRLSQPQLDPAVEEIRLNDPLRTPKPWQLRSNTSQLILYLALREPYACTTLRLEFLSADERLLWAHDEFEVVEDEIKLILPRSFLERAPARLRIYSRCEAELSLLEEMSLSIAWQ